MGKAGGKWRTIVEGEGWLADGKFDLPLKSIYRVPVRKYVELFFHKINGHGRPQDMSVPREGEVEGLWAVRAASRGSGDQFNFYSLAQVPSSCYCIRYVLGTCTL